MHAVFHGACIAHTITALSTACLQACGRTAAYVTHTTHRRARFAHRCRWSPRPNNSGHTGIGSVHDQCLACSSCYQYYERGSLCIGFRHIWLGRQTRQRGARAGDIRVGARTLTRPCTVITVVFFDMSHTGTAFFGTAVSTALREARAAARAPLLPIPSIELSTADSLCVRDQVKLTEPARHIVQYLLHALLLASSCMRTQLTAVRTPLVIHCQLLETSAPADDILCALFKIDVTRASMRTLAPNTWLVCDVRNNDPLLLYIYFYNFS